MRAREVAGEGERREEGARESGRRALPRTAVRRDLQRRALRGEVLEADRVADVLAERDVHLLGDALSSSVIFLSAL